MNKLIILPVLLLFISCATDKKQSIKTTMIAKVETTKTKTTTILKNVVTITDKAYILQFKIEKTKNKHNLVIDIKLQKGASFISPFEEKEFSGKFYMDLGDYTNLSFDKKIIETPQAVAEFDGFKKGSVIWVKENTTYIQSLNIKSDEDFEVFGRVQFTIEPRCTFEEIPFALSYSNGVFTFIDPKC